MKGSPLLRLFMVIAAFALLWIPLQHLTRARAHPTVTEPEPDAPVQVRLRILSTAVPFTFEITHLGQIIWSGEASGPDATKDLALIFPPEGIDLAVAAKWPGQTGPAALKISMVAPGNRTIEQIAWADNDLNEVLTFR
jgi:hypothetical protein